MNRNVKNKKKLIRSSKKNFNLEKSSKNTFLKKTNTYQFGESYEPGSWEPDNNNIYYKNQGGAVSVNTENVKYFSYFVNQENIIPTNPKETEFGYSVITGNQGNLVCVGDISNNQIDLYTYNKQLNTWDINSEPIVQNYSSNDEKEKSQFGYSIDMDDNYLIVGDPGLSSIYIYKFDDLPNLNYTYSMDGSFNYTFEPSSSDTLPPNLGFSVSINCRPNAIDTSYAVISGSPNTNDILWWDDGFKNWNTNSDVYNNANEYNGSNNTDVQAGKSVDIKWKSFDEYFFTAGAPNRNIYDANNGSYITDAGEIVVSQCNKQYDSIIQYVFTSHSIGENNYFGSNVFLNNDCTFLFVSSPGASDGTITNPETSEPESLTNNGIVEAYEFISEPDQTDFDLNYCSHYFGRKSNAQIGNSLQASSYKDVEKSGNPEFYRVTFGAPAVNQSYITTFDPKTDSKSFNEDAYILQTKNINDISFGYANSFSLFNGNNGEQLYCVTTLSEPKLTIYNNVGNYQFNVLGDSYVSDNLYVNKELQGPTIDQLNETILLLQKEIRDLKNAVFEPEPDSS